MNRESTSEYRYHVTPASCWGGIQQRYYFRADFFRNGEKVHEHRSRTEYADISDAERAGQAFAQEWRPQKN
jgi:hypothetical protein